MPAAFASKDASLGKLASHDLRGGEIVNPITTITGDAGFRGNIVENDRVARIQGVDSDLPVGKGLHYDSSRIIIPEESLFRAIPIEIGDMGGAFL